MGNTADEVAAVLKEKKIQGVRNTVRMLNPIVRHVAGSVPNTRDIDLIEAGTMRITFRDGKMERVALPEAIDKFLDAFNDSAYPDLELPASQG